MIFYNGPERRVFHAITAMSNMGDGNLYVALEHDVRAAKSVHGIAVSATGSLFYPGLTRVWRRDRRINSWAV